MKYVCVFDGIHQHATNSYFILCGCVCCRFTLAGFWTQMFSTNGWTRKTIVWTKGMYHSVSASVFISETTRFVWSCHLKVFRWEMEETDFWLSLSKCEEMWSEMFQLMTLFLSFVFHHPLPSVAGLQIHPQKEKTLSLSSILWRQEERKEGVRNNCWPNSCGYVWFGISVCSLRIEFCVCGQEKAWTTGGRARGRLDQRHGGPYPCS